MNTNTYNDFEQDYFYSNNEDKVLSDVLSNISENCEYPRNNQEENNTICNKSFYNEKPTSKEMNQILSENTNYYTNIYINKYNLTSTTEEISNNQISKTVLSQFTNPEKNEEKINEKEIYFLTKKTERNSDINIQSKLESDEADYNKEKKLSKEINLINKNPNQIDCIELEENKKVKFGRKKIDDSENGKHDKNSNDNIINKIKGNFINYFIRNFIKFHSINKKIDFKKLPREFIADLNKETNEALYKRKISDILRENKISSKYSSCDKYENRKIIDKIYEENKEMNVMKILELTYEELFIIFRRKLNNPKDMEKLEEIKNKIGHDLLEKKGKYEDIEYLINYIKKKYKNKLSEPQLNEYVNNVEDLCLNYKKWFDDKIGRTSKNKRNIKK